MKTIIPAVVVPVVVGLGALAAVVTLFVLAQRQAKYRTLMGKVRSEKSEAVAA